jgi:hypothetical protein
MILSAIYSRSPSSEVGRSSAADLIHYLPTCYLFQHAALTLLQPHFILVFCLSATPARLYLPEFSVRSLACQTRFQPETLGYAGSYCALGG